jgi:arsenate reductase
VPESVNVLILCTGNSARSVIAEALLNELSGGCINAYSAGSTPAGAVNPGALRVLQKNGHVVADLRSKSWDEFSEESGIEMDVVITVCDNAASKPCPAWVGAPVTVHWGIPDPAAAGDDENTVDAAFDATYAVLHARMSALAKLLLQSSSSAGELKLELDKIAATYLQDNLNE